MTNELIKIRSEIKKRKPTYKRVQANQFAKFKNDPKWRRPKGMGNKDRRNRKGHIGSLKMGYSSPKAVRGLNKHGFEEIAVYNVQDLSKVKTKSQIGLIGSTVGGRKKIEILKVAQEKKIAFSNVKDISASLKSLEEKVKKSKDSKKESTSKKATKKEEAKK